MTDKTIGDTSIDTSSPEPAGHLKGHLGAPALVFTVLAFNAPLAVMAGFVPYMIGAGNQTGVPLTFALLGVVYLAFAVGLTTMSKFMRSPGAFYSYIVAGIGRPAGLGGAFLAIATYLAFSACVYPFTGIVATSLVRDVFGGPNVDWWVWALVLWAMASGLSLLNVDFSAKILGVTMSAEIVLVVVWQIAVAIKGGPQGRSFDWHSMSSFTSGSLGLGLVFGVLCLTGFEAVAVFREETRDPLKNIPRATYAAVIILVLLYGFGAFTYIVALGPADAVSLGASDPSGSFLATMKTFVGGFASDLTSVLLVTSEFAAMLATQNIAARYFYSLGRDRVLFTRLGQIHPRHGSPFNAAAAVALLVLAIVAIPALFGVSPLQSYTAMSGFGGICLLVLLVLTALAIFLFFRRKKLPESTHLFRTAIAPAIAFVALAAALVVATMNAGSLVGGTATAGIVVVVAVAGLAIAGIFIALRYKRTQPEIYSKIGAQDL